MASKKTATDEKSKATKKGFFRRSESVMPDNRNKGITANSSLTDEKSNDSDNKRLMRRSSMICSEGFDKYTYDCRRQTASAKSVGQELNAVTPSEETVYNQSLPVSENNVSTYVQSPKPVSVDQTAVKKISSFNPLAAMSVVASAKNAPLPFKRVPEETVPANMPLSFKRVPEETVPITNSTVNNATNKSLLTAIPLSFSPRPEINIPSLKVNPSKSAPIKNTPFSFNNISDESSSMRNAPLSLKHVTDKARPVSKAFSFRNAFDQSSPSRNISLSHKPVSSEFLPARNVPLSFKVVSDDFSPSRKAHLSHGVNTNEYTSPRNVNLPLNPVSDGFVSNRKVKIPLSFTRVPEKNVSSNFVSDEPIPVRNAPLSLKGESVSLRNIPSSVKHSSNETSSYRSIPLSLQPVPEEPAPPRDFSNVQDEPIPFRNSPLSLKPMLTKHMSLLKKKTPSFKGPILKRDSVVHPGRIDMQGSLLIDGRFQNPWPTWKPPTFANILKFGVTRNKSKVPPKQELDLILPIVKQNFSKLTIPDDGIRVTWIGHSTVLVQMHGLNILTDPMFSDRASPSQVVGPKRYRDPPCTIHDLPHINAVVISHSHYDHLDHNTIMLLNARFGSDTRWFVPLGLQTWMEDVGCENVVELDWWEENCVPEHSDTFFVFTPAQHWSKRALGDDNKVLWGSWCILGPKYKFFFAGDTGYCDVFKQIGRVHGPFDVSAIPIGAYEPRWFMKYQHVNPEEAVKIHIDIKSEKSLAIHWGTFSLANEYYLDPPVKLRESLDKYEIPPELFFTLKHGESRLIPQNNLVKKLPLSVRNVNDS